MLTYLYFVSFVLVEESGVARMLKKIRTSKGDYCIKQRFPSIASLLIMGTSLKGKNLFSEGVVPYTCSMELYFTTLGDLH